MAGRGGVGEFTRNVLHISCALSQVSINFRFSVSNSYQRRTLFLCCTKKDGGYTLSAHELWNLTLQYRLIVMYETVMTDNSFGLSSKMFSMHELQIRARSPLLCQAVKLTGAQRVRGGHTKLNFLAGDRVLLYLSRLHETQTALTSLLDAGALCDIVFCIRRSFFCLCTTSFTQARHSTFNFYSTFFHHTKSNVMKVSEVSVLVFEIVWSW